VPIPVTTGISDGRHTEVEGRDLDEKMEVIVSVKQPAAP
jgi:hypothetical protein